MIPRELRPLFWDVEWQTFDPASYPDYTIARILEYGDREAVTWLQRTFSQQEIKRIISNERRLSPRSANFWALAYGIPPDDVAALKEVH